MLKLILTQGYSFNTNDYSRVHTFKVYDENDLPLDASGYTAIIKIFDELGLQVIKPVAVAWTSQSIGVGTFSFSVSNYLALVGPHHIILQLEKSTTIIGTERRKIMVFANPS